MKNINIKVIKANSNQVKETAIPAIVAENDEKKIVKKITQNVNNWVKEYQANRNSFQLPSFIH